MATGLNWYLNHFCHCHVSLHGRQLNLPDPLPAVTPKVRQVTWTQYRYFLNYCCFGYSLPWWDWDQWQELIDWMALHGVNMPLAVTGQEAVWQAVCQRLGMSDAEIAAFLAGPPFLPFQWMGCLDGWGGPLPPSWIERHEELQNKILARQRELGMTPVLQGFHRPRAGGGRGEVSRRQIAPHRMDRMADALAGPARSPVCPRRAAVPGGADQTLRHGSPVRGGHVHRNDAAQRRAGVPGSLEPRDLPGHDRQRPGGRLGPPRLGVHVQA